MARASALIAVLVLIFTLSNAQFFSLTKANPKPYYPPKITIVSPYPNQVYNSSSVLLNVTVTIYGVAFPPFDNVTSLSYSLDGQADTPIPYSRGYQSYCGSTTLSGLYNGPHSIFIHGENTPFQVAPRSSGGSPIYSEKTTFNATVSFTVNVQTTDDFQENILGAAPLTFLAIIVLVAVAIVVAGAAVVYLKKRSFWRGRGQESLTNPWSRNVDKNPLIPKATHVGAGDKPRRNQLQRFFLQPSSWRC